MTVAGVRIRAAEVADLADVIRLERAAVEAPHWAEREYAAILEGEGEELVKRRLVVAEREGRLLGFAVGKVIGRDAATVAELESVAVEAAARRGGVGGMLCRAISDWCSAQGAATLELEVRAGSAGAIALYRGLGFESVGRRAGYYRDPAEDAVLMQLELAASK